MFWAGTEQRFGASALLHCGQGAARTGAARSTAGTAAQRRARPSRPNVCRRGIGLISDFARSSRTALTVRTIRRPWAVNLRHRRAAAGPREPDDRQRRPRRGESQLPRARPAAAHSVVGTDGERWGGRAQTRMVCAEGKLTDRPPFVSELVHGTRERQTHAPCKVRHPQGHWQEGGR